MQLVVYVATNPEGEQVRRVGIDDGSSKKPVYPLLSVEYAAEHWEWVLDNVSQIQGDYGMYWYLDLKVTEQVLGSR
jgi:hypothetical protein